MAQDDPHPQSGNGDGNATPAQPVGKGNGGERHGPIAWFARNHVASNLLFLLLIVAGAASVLQTKLAVFPEVDPNIVTINVPYPGATPQEVEQGVVLRVEEAVENIEGVKEVRGTAVENQAAVIVEAETYANMDEVTRDVQNAVDRIDNFPEQVEEAVVAEASDRRQVLTMVLYGSVERDTLKEQAERIKDDLTDSGQISFVEITGLPPYEISIEIDEATLRRYGLTFAEISAAIRASSIDLPAGEIENESSQILVRTTNQAYTGDEFAQIVVRRNPDGSVIRVEDVARVIDSFEDNDFAVSFNGQPAVLLNVYRIGNEGALNIASTVEQYLETAGERLPPSLELAIYNDSSKELRSRISLLLKNALIGLVLVVLLLAMFLDLRLAFWATAGLAMSFIASITVLPIVDVSINMISLFAYVLVLGILVDDAIVVGENIHAHREMGKSPINAAIDGAREVAVPVTMTILSTVVAFAPLLFGEGTVGQILAVIPIVVITTLIVSLVEALFILPAHLSGNEPYEPRFYVKIRDKVQRRLDWVIQKPYHVAVEAAVRGRYVTIGIAIATLLVTVGWVWGGFIPWRFFPPVEAEIVTAIIEMPPGASAARTQDVTDRIADAAEQLRGEFTDSEGNAVPLIRNIQVAVGGQPFTAIRGGPGQTSGYTARDPRLAEVLVELVPSGERDVTADQVTQRWRQLVGPVAGARSIEYESELLSAGSPISIRLSSPDFSETVAAAEELKQRLAEIEGVIELSDSYQEGKPQVEVVGLTPVGRALGLTVADVARQVRGAFFGDQAQEVQRGRDEVKVYVRYPEHERRTIGNIENLFIRLPDGSESPLSLIADIRIGEGFTTIERVDRRRVVNVTGDIDTSRTTAGGVNNLIRNQILPSLQQQYGRLSYTLEGEQEEQQESLASLGLALVVALIGIYGMLAVQFRSYVQPFIVMSAIPFGVIGAVWGHVIVDLFKPMPLSFLSLFGVVALTGVVVNDSLILIDLINRRRQNETNLTHIAIDSGMRRFRPILLTTLTTFFGLVPIILETSLQAQFVIPMAVSLGFGVLFSTMITLLLVPSLYMLIEDGRRLMVPYFGDEARYLGPGIGADNVPASS